MSTSPKPSPAEVRGPDPSRPPTATPAVQPFPYDAIPPDAISPGARRRISHQPGLVSAEAVFGARQGGIEQNRGGEARTREDEARARAREEGKAEAGRAFDEQLVRERASLAAALGQFTRDRAAYFEKIEGEVVRLALSIARKILYREAQVDPLLLAGIVRVALEKIDGATGVRLHVHPRNAPDWRRFFSTQLEPSDVPDIIEDPAQGIDTCTLETSMGTAVVGLEVQLREIEQGLMDLLAARPDVGGGAKS
jgi:flagellar biosynthesis/type III secretory pathway protein FliH